jgi:hypothetical protein
MYQRHPSRKLNELFRSKPFQGNAPENSKFVFIGLDANYQENLEHEPSFQDVLEYHRDGVEFWRHRGVHHPFLLPSYHGDGRRYHRNFARIGLTPLDAGLVSFVELLDVPTTGRSQLVPGDVADHHLDYLRRVVWDGQAEHVFVSSGVLRILQATSQFASLKGAKRSNSVLPVIHRAGALRVHLHLHFSNYGKFQAQMDLEAEAIRSLFIAHAGS